jgi:hypothetical protein
MRPKALSFLSATAAVLLAVLAIPVFAGSPPVELPAEAPAFIIEGAPVQCVGDSCDAAPRRAAVRHSAPRRVVVNQTNNVTVVAGSAQADAEVMAATGRLRHQGNNGGCREGIGYSTTSADDAIRRCCFYGRYRAREIGVARGSRGYYACVRYE